MSNPTLSAGSQFTGPFNILPDVIYTNPTTATGNQYIVSIESPTAPTPKQFISSIEGWNNWAPGIATNTNITVGGTVTKLIGATVLSAASGLGIPQVAQFGQSIIEYGSQEINTTISIPQYATLTLGQLKSFPGVLYSDFRSRISYSATSNPNVADDASNRISGLRLDGTSAAIRRSFKAGAYAIASALPVGAYSIFNLNGAGKSGHGWGDHDNPYAIRSDFTARSHVAKRWAGGSEISDSGPGLISTTTVKRGNWAPTRNPIEKLTPFRGDRVSVIDFGQRSLAEAYLWNPNIFGAKGKFGAVMNKLGITQDFIKFYMTGPKLFNGAASDVVDDIMVFRATINSLSDSFNANWTPSQMVGRADPNYQYTGFSRDLNLDFTVYATDRDEMQPIWRKLNALAGYTAPTYTLDSIALKAPWMRITIGDLFVQTPVILSSVSYTLHDADTTWEINIEDDPTMMQAPHKVSVSCTFTVIGDSLPQKNGRFYSLAKEFDSSGSAKLGSDNWLSDSLSNSDLLSGRQQKFQKSKNTGTLGGPELTSDELSAINIANKLTNVAR